MKFNNDIIHLPQKYRNIQIFRNTPVQLISQVNSHWFKAQMLLHVKTCVQYVCGEHVCCFCVRIPDETCNSI